MFQGALQTAKGWAQYLRVTSTWLGQILFTKGSGMFLLWSTGACSHFLLLHRDGFNILALDKQGLDRNGYNIKGFDKYVSGARQAAYVQAVCRDATVKPAGMVQSSMHCVDARGSCAASAPPPPQHSLHIDIQVSHVLLTGCVGGAQRLASWY